MKWLCWVLLFLLISTIAFCADIVVEDIGEATPYYKAGTSSDCGTITTDDTAGDLEAAEDARGAGDTLYVCAGTYTGAELDSDSVFGVSSNAGSIEAVGTVNLDSDGANYTIDIREGGNLTISGFNISGAVLYQILFYSSTAAVDTVRITNCTIDGAAGSHAIRLDENVGGTITNIEIDNNTIINAGNGAGNNDCINVFEVTSGMDIHDNTIYNCGSGGIDFAGGSGAVIENNYIYNTGLGIKTHGQQYNVENAVIRYNLILRNSSNAGDGMLLYDLTTSTVINNTIYVASGANHYAAMKFGESEVAGSFHDNVIRNNLSYGNPDYNSGCWHVVSNIIDDFDTANTFGNNLIYTGNATIVYMDTGTNIVAANWASVWIPNHANDVNSDPLLDSDYKLTAGSPAKDAGLDVDCNACYDMNGDLVTAADGSALPRYGGINIGAYENKQMGNVGW